MDNLKTIQKIMKVMKVITRIGYVMCVVGGSICLVSILVLLVLDKTGLMADEDIKAIYGRFSVSYCKAIKDIPGFTENTYDKDAIFSEIIKK